MTLEIQKKVAAFVEKHGLENPLPIHLLDLHSELGELSRELLKSSAYGLTSFTPGARWHDELGDVLFSLICVANSTGVDLEHVLDLAMQKYASRIARKGDPGSGE